MNSSTDGLTRKGRETRARLIAAAEQELLAVGRLEVTKVAERAGASLGLLYRYFENKDGMVEAVVDGFYDRYEEAVFNVPAPADALWLDHEEARIDREVSFLFADPLAPRIVGGTPEEPAAALADARRLRRHIALAARNIRRGLERGQISVSVDPGLAASAIIGSLRACLATALDDGRTLDQADVVETVLRVSAGVISPAT